MFGDCCSMQSSGLTLGQRFVVPQEFDLMVPS